MARSSVFLALLAALLGALLLAHAPVASADALSDAQARVQQCVPAAARRASACERTALHAHNSMRRGV